jgi:hypothetical protein
VKDENGDLLADSHNILNRWKNYFPRPLNIHSVRDGRQIEIHTSQPFIPASSYFQFERTTTKLKKHKSSGSDQILEEQIQAGGDVLWSDIHKLIHFSLNKEE